MKKARQTKKQSWQRNLVFGDSFIRTFGMIAIPMIEAKDVKQRMDMTIQSKKAAFSAAFFI